MTASEVAVREALEQVGQHRPLAELEAAGILTDVGLRMDGLDIPYERWALIGEHLGDVSDALRWAIGDWILWGEKTYGERYAQAVEATGLRPETLMNYVSICKRVAFSRRRGKRCRACAGARRLLDGSECARCGGTGRASFQLRFGHHAEVAALEPDEQDEMLERAVGERWTRDRLREEVRGGRAIERSAREEHVRLDEGEREVVEAYRELRAQYPRLVTPERAREALERQVVVDARPAEPTLAASAVANCPACGRELEPANGPEGPREE